MEVSLFDTKEEYQEIIRRFSDEPIDAISVSTYEYHQKAFATDKNMAQLTREVTELPIMICGSIYDRASAEEALKDADIILSGKSLPLNPNWGVVRFFMYKGIKTVLGHAEYDMYMAPFRKRSERAPTHIFPYQLEHAEKYVAEIERNFETIADRPALIIWGLKDFAFQQTERERFQTLFREHEVVLLEGAGHFIQEDAAEEICNAVHEWFPQDKETG